MGGVPQTPDPQARNAVVTSRIITHVTAGRPPPRQAPGQLPRPVLLRRRALPGHREPTPFLRPHWQGDPDEWAIAIYKASTAQTNSPGAFGGISGTLEQEIDETITLYVSPQRGNERAHPKL